MELYLKNIDTACQIIDGLIPIVWKFDGKVYNARFDNAIKDYLASKEEYSQINSSLHFGTSKVTLDLIFYHRSVCRTLVSSVKSKNLARRFWSVSFD